MELIFDFVNTLKSFMLLLVYPCVSIWSACWGLRLGLIGVLGCIISFSLVAVFLSLSVANPHFNGIILASAVSSLLGWGVKFAKRDFLL